MIRHLKRGMMVRLKHDEHFLPKGTEVVVHNFTPDGYAVVNLAKHIPLPGNSIMVHRTRLRKARPWWWPF